MLGVDDEVVETGVTEEFGDGGRSEAELRAKGGGVGGESFFDAILHRENPWERVECKYYS